MVETSLVEIFSGNVPRIDTTSIFIGRGSRVDKVDLRRGVCIVGKDCFVFNDWKFRTDVEKYHGSYSTDVFLERTEGGFGVVRGFVPPRFQGRFFMEEWVTFRVEELPLDDLVSETVSRIKEAQDNLDSGVVSMTHWANLIKLWAGVKNLNYLLAELSSEQEIIS